MSSVGKSAPARREDRGQRKRIFPEEVSPGSEYSRPRRERGERRSVIGGHPLPVPLPYGRHMWVLGTTRGGKVIAGSQLMVDALVGLPQLLLDRALARIRPSRRWIRRPAAKSRGGGTNRDRTAALTHGANEVASEPAPVNEREDDTGHRGGVSGFRSCGRQRPRVRED